MLINYNILMHKMINIEMYLTKIESRRNQMLWISKARLAFKSTLLFQQVIHMTILLNTMVISRTHLKVTINIKLTYQRSRGILTEHQLEWLTTAKPNYKRGLKMTMNTKRQIPCVHGVLGLLKEKIKSSKTNSEFNYQISFTSKIIYKIV